MSIIGIVIHNTGALIMGDTKLNNNPNRTKIRKIFKRGNILLGFTGNVNDVRQYLFPLFNQDMSLNKEYDFDEPDQFLWELDNRFNYAVANGIKYDIVFVVIIKSDLGYTARRFCLSDNDELKISSYTIISNNTVQYLILGNERHIQFFDEYVSNNSPVGFGDFILAFQKTLDNGIVFDNTINNIMQYEFL